MKKYTLCSMIVFWLFVIASNAAAAADEDKYRIGPGDIIEISVWRDGSLNREVVVPPDGMVAFPLAGELDVTDMTVTELRKAITEKLSAFVPDATVTVIIKKINSLKAYVIGKVNNPGEFDITMNTSVIQILAMAHGLNPFAAATKIQILRHKKNLTVKIPFNYNQAQKGINLKQNIILQRGDVVVVP